MKHQKARSLERRLTRSRDLLESVLEDDLDVGHGAEPEQDAEVEHPVEPRAVVHEHNGALGEVVVPVRLGFVQDDLDPAQLLQQKLKHQQTVSERFPFWSSKATELTTDRPNQMLSEKSLRT